MFLAKKTTQAAAKLVQRANGRIPYLALLKLLYFADKEMLIKWGVPITFDQWFSMKHGPVLSNTYNLIKSSPSVHAVVDATASDYWGLHLRKNGYDMQLVNDPGDDLLSEAEDEIINKVFAEHGTKDKWELRDLTHELPEWNDPGNSSQPITYEEVLRVNGLSAEAIDEVVENIHTQREIAFAFAEVQ